MTTRFSANLKAEFLKLKRTPAIWLTLVAAAFLPFINCMICIERPQDMIPKFETTHWLTFLRFNWKNTVTIIFPVYVILLVNQVLQVEYRNGTWKLVYACPRSYSDIFLSKFLVINTFIICFLIMFNLFTVTSAFTANWVEKGYPFLKHPIPWTKMLILSSRFYVGMLGVIAIQYWLSRRFHNFIIPLGVGFGLWIFGIALLDWEKIIYHPYMYSTLMFFTDESQEPDRIGLLLQNAIVCFVVVFGLSFWNIYSLKERA